MICEFISTVMYILHICDSSAIRRLDDSIRYQYAFANRIKKRTIRVKSERVHCSLDYSVLFIPPLPPLLLINIRGFWLIQCVVIAFDHFEAAKLYIGIVFPNIVLAVRSAWCKQRRSRQCRCVWESWTYKLVAEIVQLAPTRLFRSSLRDHIVVFSSSFCSSRHFTFLSFHHCILMFCSDVLSRSRYTSG